MITASAKDTIYVFPGLKEPLEIKDSEIVDTQGSEIIPDLTIMPNAELKGIKQQKIKKDKPFQEDKRTEVDPVIDIVFLKDSIFNEETETNMATALYHDIRLSIPAEIRNMKSFYQINIIQIQKFNAKIKVRFNFMSAEISPVVDINKILNGVVDGIRAFIKIRRGSFLNVQIKIQLSSKVDLPIKNAESEEYYDDLLRGITNSLNTLQRLKEVGILNLGKPEIIKKSRNSSIDFSLEMKCEDIFR